MSTKIKGLVRFAVAVAVVGVLVGVGRRYLGWDQEVALGFFRRLEAKLGLWAAPAYLLAHTASIALCLPSAVFMEAGASLLFGFLPAVLCVFSAKVLGASLSFWIGRAVIRSSTSAREWVTRNRYFHLIVRGVEKDGWKFVLLARFSPLPSYVINYALAATNVMFMKDFLFPTVIGCLPMILQNTSIGSLAGAAVSSATGSKKSGIFSYIFPFLGIGSSILISVKIKSYSSTLSVAEELKSPSQKVAATDGETSQAAHRNSNSTDGLKKRH